MKRNNALNNRIGKMLKYRVRRSVALLLTAALLATIPTTTWAATAVKNNEFLKVDSLGYYPGGILADEEGNVYVKDCTSGGSTQGQVYRYKENGVLDTAWGVNGHTNFPAQNRGVGLSFNSDGNLITTCYDGTIHQVNAENGNTIKTIQSDFTAYCSVLNNGNTYVIGKPSSGNPRVKIYDSQLNEVSDEVLPEIQITEGYYGLAIAGDRIYATSFGSYVYAYIRTEQGSWVKDSSFGTNGKLKVFNSAAGGLFYNETDGKIYACSESDNKIYSFNPDGSNITEVLTGAGPNNLYISDAGYAVPFFGGRSFQVFYRPSNELEKDKFSVLLDNKVNVETRDPLKLTITTSSTTERQYKIAAQLIDSDGKVVAANCPPVSLSRGSAKITVTPDNPWKAGTYKIQLIISSTLSGTSVTISETVQIDAAVSVGTYEVYYNKPTNGKLSHQGFVSVNQVQGDVGSVTTVTATPDEYYEVDLAASSITPDNSGVLMTAVGNDITMSGIKSDIEVSIMFKMNSAQLDAKKKAAIAQLKAGFEGEDCIYKAENYFGDNWTKLIKIKGDAETAIQMAATADEVDRLLSAALGDMARIPNRDTDATRKKLIEEAEAAVNSKYEEYTKDPNAYSEDQLEKLKDALTKALEEIRKAATESEINVAREAGLSSMAGIPTKTQETLNAKKAEIKAALEAAKTQLSPDTNYEGKALAEILGKYNELYYKIENAAAESELEHIVEDFNKFVTDGDYLTKLEKTEFIKNINDEVKKLSSSLYTEENWKLVQAHQNVGVAAINGSDKKSVAEVARDSAIANIQSVKTKDEQLEENRRPYLKAVEDAYATYKEGDYTDANWIILTKFKADGVTEIQAAENAKNMEAAKNTAIAGMAAVETKLSALKVVKDQAIADIQAEYKKWSDQAEKYSTDQLKKLEDLLIAGMSGIQAAGEEAVVTAAKSNTIAAMQGVKQIDILLSADAIVFDQLPYSYAVPPAEKLTITAVLEGCEEVVITQVELSKDTQFTLAEEGGRHLVTAAGKNEDWSVTPKEGLKPGTYEAKLIISYDCEGKAADEKEVNVSFTVVEADQAKPEGLTVTHQIAAGQADGSINNVTTAMEWKKDSQQDYTKINKDGVLEKLDPGSYHVRLAKKDYYNASEDTELMIKMVQATVISATPTMETGYGKKDGTITVSGSNKVIEYRMSGETTYRDSVGTRIEGLSAGTYYVRLKETADTLAGKEIQVILTTNSHRITYQYDSGLGTITAEDGSALADTIGNNGFVTIKITPADGYELLPDNIQCEKANSQELGSGLYKIGPAIGNVKVNVKFTPTQEKEELENEKTAAIASVSDAMKPETAEKYLDYKDELNLIVQAAKEQIEAASDSNAVKLILDQTVKELVEVKSEALQDYRDQLASPSDAILSDRNEEDYSRENWEKLQDYQEAAQKALKDELTPKDLVEKIEEILQKVVGIPTISQETEEYQKELQEKKDSIIASMSDAIPNDKEDYSSGGWSKIQELITKAKEDIKNAGTTEAVETIWEKLCEDIAMIPTRKEELEAARNKALETLFQTFTYQYDEEDYTDDYWLMLEEYYREGEESIEAAENPKAVEKALEKVLKDMKDVRTLKEMGSEQKKDPSVVLLEDLIKKLPNPTSSLDELEAAKEKIIRAKELYDSLGELKGQTDKELLQKLDKLIIKLMDITFEIHDNGLGLKADGLIGLLMGSDEMAGSASDVRVILSVNAVDGTQSDSAAVLELLGRSGKIGKFLDITIEKKVDGVSFVITALSQPIEMRITIPSELRGNKNYKVVRIHEGKATILETQQEGNILIFSTDRFSTYVLTYESDGSSGTLGGSGSGSGGSDGGVGYVKPQGASGTWQQDQTGWWFKSQDGSYPVSQWLYIGENWYHFDQVGYMQTGWLQLDQTSYYLRADGAMSTGWVFDNQQWYYMDASGTMAENEWITYHDGWYYIGANGILVSSQWFEYQGQWYYLGSDGRMAVDVTINGRYVGQDGVRK